MGSMGTESVEVGVVVNTDNDLLLVFPMGKGPQDPDGNLKPVLGFGVQDRRPALFVLSGPSPHGKEAFFCFLPIEAFDAYQDRERVLVAEADPGTQEVRDRGWMRAVDLFRRHIRDAARMKETGHA